jgi:hypothetical protein
MALSDMFSVDLLPPRSAISFSEVYILLKKDDVADEFSSFSVFYIILERAYIFFKLDTETETKLKELFRSFFFKRESKVLIKTVLSYYYVKVG